MLNQDDEYFEQAFPTPKQQAPYLGKVVAFDNTTGEVRDSAATYGELLERLTDEALESLTLLYIPGFNFVARGSRFSASGSPTASSTARVRFCA
jgi:hypothetical protein